MFESSKFSKSRTKAFNASFVVLFNTFESTFLVIYDIKLPPRLLYTSLSIQSSMKLSLKILNGIVCFKSNLFIFANLSIDINFVLSSSTNRTEVFDGSELGVAGLLVRCVWMRVGDGIGEGDGGVSGVVGR